MPQGVRGFLFLRRCCWGSADAFPVRKGIAPMRTGTGWLMVMTVVLAMTPSWAEETKDQELARLKKERAALDQRIRELEGQPSSEPKVEISRIPVARPIPRGNVVVTDTRIERDRSTVGRSMTVVTEEDMELSGKREAQEVLRDVPSAQVVRTAGRGGTTSLFLRGGDANFVSVMVDGVRMNKDGGSFDFENFGIDAIDRVEVLRGAGSSLYGSDSLAGVVNFITRKGDGPATLRTSFEYGSFETMRERFSLVGGDDRFGYRIGGSNLQQRGSVFVNSNYDDRNFGGRFDLRLSPDMTAMVSVRSVESHLGVYTTSAGADYEPPNANAVKDRSSTLTALSFFSDASPDWKSRLTLYRYFDAVKSSNPKFPGEVSQASEVYSFTEFARQGWAWQNDFILPRGHTFTAGVDHEAEDYDSLRATIGTAPTAANAVDKTRTNSALFVQDIWDVDKRLTLMASARRDHNSAFGDDDTGQTALSWKTFDGGPRLHASLGMGSKIPTFSQIYGSTTTVGLIGTSDGVRVTRSRTFDAGLEQAWGRMVADVTFFEHKYRDLVETATGVTAQGGAAVARGFEFTLDADPATWLHLHADMTLMDTNVLYTRTTGTSFVPNDELLRRAGRQANASAVFKPSETWNARLGMRYMGSRVDRNFWQSPSGTRQHLSSYTLFDASTSWTLPDARWRLFATAENLLDLQYQEIIGFPSPGFNMMGGVEYAYVF